ncbi:hypothetical protein K32_15130 [Kaistia sp. 32K]|uniref:nuclear transport factor 2 family protein n=1 Tax=Kaistia sp. 32K TaxID=2795690 RepID=UPI0019158F7B|nr:nuclear transport factor 2 family protein [Kaistia sp. 32K]BCP52896.1 hypothetical protein K32_15130 [Kaistia sp. 32K]
MATQQGVHTHPAMNPVIRKLADEIQPLLDGIGACMDRGDAREAATYFTDDANVISPSGLTGSGITGVQRVLAADMASILKGTQSHFTIEAVRPLGDVAFVDALHEISGIEAAGGQPFQIHLVALVRKQGNSWKLLEARPYAFMPPMTKH